MATNPKAEVLDELRRRYGEVRKLKGSESLFSVGKEAARVYFRYSKVHPRGRAFFGLRQVDLRQLESHNSYLCLLLDDGSPPVFVPYSGFEEVFRSSTPAADGQIKAQLITRAGPLELYVARQGRFNIEGYVGYETLQRAVEAQRFPEAKALSHTQVQSLLAGIGRLKGYDVFIPQNDAGRLDWSLTERFPLRPDVPAGFERVRGTLEEIDVIWLAPGRNTLEALYEVEYSTPNLLWPAAV